MYQIRNVLVLLISVLLISCDNESIVNPIWQRSNYLIAGDTIHCSYFEYEPAIQFNAPEDSLDIDADAVSDIVFLIDDVFDDNCDYADACPPGMECDCWPNIYTDYILELKGNIAIAVDQDSYNINFEAGDTISGNSRWLSNLENPLLHRTPDDGFTGDQIVGLRKIVGGDTLFGWMHLEIDNSGFQVYATAIQR